MDEVKGKDWRRCQTKVGVWHKWALSKFWYITVSTYISKKENMWEIFWIYLLEYIVDIFGANLKFTSWFPLNLIPISP